MCHPMAKGNFILLKGKWNSSGKNLLIKGAIKRFIETEEDGREIYVSLS